MTRELLNKLPAHVVEQMNQIRKDYKNPALNKDEVRNMNYGYTKGLRDAGLITERERQILYIYGTV